MFSRPACSSPSRYILFQNINVWWPVGNPATFLLWPFLREIYTPGALSTTKAYTDVHDEWAKEVQRASAGEDRPWVKSRTSRRDQSREGASIHGKWVSDTYSGIHPATFPEDTDPSTSADEKMTKSGASLLQIAEGSAAAAAAAVAAAVPRPPPRAPAPEQRRLRARPWLACGALPAAGGVGGRRAAGVGVDDASDADGRRRRRRRRRARPRRDPTTRSRCGTRRRSGTASR